MERVMIFIDGSNLYYGLKGNACSTAIDFFKLSRFLTKCRRKLIRTYYYNAAYKQEDNPRKYIEQQKFFTRLKRTPYLTLKLGRLVKHVTKLDRNWLKQELKDEAMAGKIIKFLGQNIISYTEKGVDIQIASDMLKLAYSNAYDTGILVSGDGDFVAAIDSIKDLGKHIENAYFKKGRSNYLLEACDKFILLNSTIVNSCLAKLKIRQGEPSRIS